MEPAQAKRATSQAGSTLSGHPEASEEEENVIGGTTNELNEAQEEGDSELDELCRAGFVAKALTG